MGTEFEWRSVTDGSHQSAQLQAASDSNLSALDQATVGTLWKADTTWSSAPQMTYTVSVPAAGKYYLNVYSYSWNTDSDSFHFILNNTHQFRAGKDENKFTNEGQWGSIKGDKWFYGAVQLDLQQGENTITIAGRKSGFVLRQIMLSPVQQNDLTGWLETGGSVEPTAVLPMAEDNMSVLPVEQVKDALPNETPGDTPAVPDGEQPDASGPADQTQPDAAADEEEPVVPDVQQPNVPSEPDIPSEEEPSTPDASQSGEEADPGLPAQGETTIGEPRI